VWAVAGPRASRLCRVLYIVGYGALCYLSQNIRQVKRGGGGLVYSCAPADQKFGLESGSWAFEHCRNTMRNERKNCTTCFTEEARGYET
jgi:hypothetical protein